MSEKMTDEQVVARFNELVKAGRVDLRTHVLHDWRLVATSCAYRLHPEPCRIPLTQTDWAGGPWYVRTANEDKQTWYYVMAVSPIGSIEIRDYELAIDPQQLFNDFERSRDCIIWEPCWREIK